MTRESKKTVAIIQARVGSSRFPAKVLADIGGEPMLARVVGRVRQARLLDQVVVATTVAPADDAVEQLCQQLGIACFRGSEQDVLSRYHAAATEFQANLVVRLTADCPLLAPEVIDQVVAGFHESGADYASNVIPPTYPDGLDTEAFSFAALDAAHREATLPSDREHVTPFIHTRPERFKRHNVEHREDLSAWRWTVDEQVDLDLVRAVYERFGTRSFSFEDAVQFIRSDLRLLNANKNIRRNEGYAKSLRDDQQAQTSANRFRSGAGQSLYRRAKRRMPGGTQLLSKRPEMFLPELWPAYYSRAKGAEVWDLDGNHYYDLTHSGIGTCLLGYADPDVDAAVVNAIQRGSMSTLNCPEEVELADLLCELHPWADMVRYCRTGGEAMSIAVRIARAKTGRETVAFCGYHGWSDWYLAANLDAEQGLDGHLLPGLDPAGVPRSLAGSVLPFRYNQLDELRGIVEQNKGKLAAIVTEPLRYQEPQPGYFAELRQLADKAGAVLIVDEITAGFRLTSGGAHLLYNGRPDLAVFAKGMSNGYPMAAILGTAGVMQAAQDTFISSTYWTERVGPTAALATIRKHLDLDLATHLGWVGDRLREGWTAAAEQAGLPIKLSSMRPAPSFSIDHPEGQAAATYFTQAMLERGFLAGRAVYATLAHNEPLLQRYFQAVRPVFGEIARALAGPGIRPLLQGPVAHTGFARIA